VSRFSDTPLDCSFVSFSAPQTFGINLTLVVVAGESGKRSVLSKRSVFSTAIKLPPAAAADVDIVYR
jgi:hypothetical protein